MFLLALLLADGLLFVLELYIADRLGDLCSTGAHCYGDAIRHALMLIVDSTAHNLLTHDKLRRWRVFRKKKKRKCRCCPHPPQRGPALRRALLADVFSEEGGHTGRPTQPSEPLSLAARRAYRQRTKPARMQRQQESTSRTAHHPRGEPCCSLRFAWEHSAARSGFCTAEQPGTHGGMGRCARAARSPAGALWRAEADGRCRGIRWDGAGLSRSCWGWGGGAFRLRGQACEVTTPGPGRMGPMPD